MVKMGSRLLLILLPSDIRFSRMIFQGHRFAPEISRSDPLPHQRIAVYELMLKRPRLRFLPADGAGAGKTIMAGPVIRKMLARQRIRRVLIVPPAGLIGNWQRELKDLFQMEATVAAGQEMGKGNHFSGEGSDLIIVSLDTLLTHVASTAACAGIPARRPGIPRLCGRKTRF
jgi:hypothetical protein